VIDDNRDEYSREYTFTVSNMSIIVAAQYLIYITYPKRESERLQDRERRLSADL
jgi:hypothetical protein